MLQINVLYLSWFSVVYTETPEYDLENFLSDVGGTSGLILGMSFATGILIKLIGSLILNWDFTQVSVNWTRYLTTRGKTPGTFFEFFIPKKKTKRFFIIYKKVF